MLKQKCRCTGVGAGEKRGRPGVLLSVMRLLCAASGMFVTTDKASEWWVVLCHKSVIIS